MLSYLVLSGLTTGSIYALVALGIVLVYKATGTINFAHGDQLMIAGFLAYTLHVMLGLPYLVAMLGAVIGSFLLGALAERIGFRAVLRSNLINVVLATLGLSFVLKGVARLTWGGISDYLSFPPLVSPDPIMIGDLILLPQQLVVTAGALVVMGLFALFFRLTTIGRAMQATADNPKAARLVGIRVEHIHMLAFAVGAAVAGAGATLMAPLTLLYPDIGFTLFIKGFAAAVLGGLTSLPGALVGGLAIGIVEALAAGYIHSSFLEVSAFIAIMLTLVLRPRGLMGGPPPRRA
ncbi:branched-chain amino acid ABC transporter permease [Siccirubricoccus phaeus]|uniref:branched-chain amino acid ABC transporter permease n=1 Tax=Siccirubricoccus phaeus TaxID=2595053 RepID=UPI0011F3A854|nr:branched-chain amino acid ABC transporter permease [Siccirubricoccus phaeus]